MLAINLLSICRPFVRTGWPDLSLRREILQLECLIIRAKWNLKSLNLSDYAIWKNL